MTQKKVDLSHPEHDFHVSVQGILQQTGARVWSMISYLGGVGMLVVDVCRSLFFYPVDLKYIVRQRYDIGVKSLSLTNVIAVFTGMVVALQFIVGLKRFGLQLYAGQVVG